ncbi:hypothetical protein B9Z41_01475 [Limnohabitans sp. JirII-31]|nr:hypothetical protein B9Z41_01475 [Limnohabitans sp. JirII-31]
MPHHQKSQDRKLLIHEAIDIGVAWDFSVLSPTFVERKMLSQKTTTESEKSDFSLGKQIFLY